jgi:hypothetical protein
MSPREDQVRMPYEISFSKRVPVSDREQYINECCIGGDVVIHRLLPLVQARYSGIQTNQEDWGWFIWFRRGAIRLAVDVFTEDPAQGVFRVHLTSRTKRFLAGDKVVDTPELEEVRALVESELEAWTGRPLQVTRLDRNYM